MKVFIEAQAGSFKKRRYDEENRVNLRK